MKKNNIKKFCGFYGNEEYHVLQNVTGHHCYYLKKFDDKWYFRGYLVHREDDPAVINSN